jgi:hypothetical protein
MTTAWAQPVHETGDRYPDARPTLGQGFKAARADRAFFYRQSRVGPQRTSKDETRNLTASSKKFLPPVLSSFEPRDGLGVTRKVPANDLGSGARIA